MRFLPSRTRPMARQAGRRVRAIGVRVLLAALVVFGVLPVANAAERLEPLIESGREHAVEHLFDPYADGQEVAPGWRLGDIHINRTVIEVDLKGATTQAKLQLKHHDRADPSAARSQSFGTSLIGPPDAREAANRLIAAIAKNDHGGFWTMPAPSPETPTALGLWRVLTDAVTLTLFAILGLLLHLRRALQALPRRATWLLIGITVVGTVLRGVIAVPTIMNGWPYMRIVPAVRMMAEGDVLPAILGATGRHISVFDAMFHFDFLVACLTPAAIFAHARYVLGDWRSAIAAAALMALLPLHIRFSHADTELILTLGLSSLSFLALYASMRAERARDRWLARPVLLLAGIASYFVRPEAVALAGVDMGAILLTAGVGVPLRRRIAAGAIVATSAGYLFWEQGHRFFDRVQDAGEKNIFLIGLTSMFNPQKNPVIDPWITPPLVLFLVFAGGVWLWRSGQRGKTVYLGGWLLGMFFVYYVHGIPAMQARYHLSLATPIVLLAAAATPWVLSWQRPWLRNALVVGVLLSPLLHLNFERDTDYTELHEFQFVRAAAKLVPDGCTVIEYVPLRDPEHPQKHLHGRWDAVGRDINAQGMTQRWPIGDADDWLQHPPPQLPKCLYYYEGLSCYSHRPLDAPIAPMCAAWHAQAKETLVSAALPYRFYDILHASPFDPDPHKQKSVSPRIATGASTLVSLMRIR